MRYKDTKILIAWARLQLEIATARQAPGQLVDVTPATITKSKGYQDLHAFAQRLSKPKRARFIADLKSQMDGIREVVAKAKLTGETLSMADIVIEVRDAETGIPILDEEERLTRADRAALGQTPSIQALATVERRMLGMPIRDTPRVRRCVASGRGIGDIITEGASKLVACPECGASWNAYDIGFAIPPHEPQPRAAAAGAQEQHGTD